MKQQKMDGFLRKPPSSSSTTDTTSKPTADEGDSKKRDHDAAITDAEVVDPKKARLNESQVAKRERVQLLAAARFTSTEPYQPRNITMPSRTYGKGDKQKIR